MASHELPEMTKTYTANATDLAYSKTEANGHALAGKDIAVEVSGNDTVRPVRAGNAVAGKLELVMANGTCLVTTGGQDLGFLQGVVGGVVRGESIVGAVGPSIGGQTNGYVGSPGDGDTTAGRTERIKARGLVTSKEANLAGSSVRVTLP